jgi:intracellular septation protein
MGSQLQLPTRVWRKLCWIWVAHFSMVGVLNLVVAYRFSEATWVAYKLWSAIAFTLFIMLITMLVMAPWLKSEKMASDTGREQDSH